MRFEKRPQLPGAGRTRAGHHHGSHTPTSPGAILHSKMACQPEHIGCQCTKCHHCILERPYQQAKVDNIRLNKIIFVLEI